MILLKKHSTTTLPRYNQYGRVQSVFPSFYTLGAIEFFLQLFLTVGGQISTILARKTGIYKIYD